MERNLFDLYMEIVRFLFAQPGYYQEIDPVGVCIEIIEALHNGQYYLACDDDGITAYCHYWKIDPNDLPLVATGRKPEDTTSGTLLYVRDFAQVGSRHNINRMVRHLRTACADCQGVTWNREGDALKYFPSQKGADHGRCAKD